ncbi:cyclin-D5-1-like [Lotus japonicus]|uniref:cyclin-D5-1-like n=1 Tax=Lotus japonicus TaxID=34305 RepID=UPI00258479AE|nr:cyclin-D5-1-like [Lotus japonicus]
MDDLSSTSSLLCEENVTCLGDEDEQQQLQHPFIQSELGFCDEHVAVLIEREAVFGFKKDESLLIEDWLKHARMDAINWILKTRATFGFRFQTAYLSVTYFDRILSKRSVDSENKFWAIRLLSIACLSLAAKMEECNVPGLSEFHWEDYSFQGKVIQNMELLVLTTLEWNMDIVTPFAFLHYFVTKLCSESPPSPIFSKTIQLIVATMKEVNLMDHKPSVIAAAATLVALDQKLTIEAVKLKMSSIPQLQLIEPNDVFGCYILIQRLYEEEKTRGDKLLHTPNSSPFRSRPIDMTENSQATSSKRRRLTFDDEQSHDGKGLDQESPKP